MIFSLPVCSRWIPCLDMEEPLVWFVFLWLGAVCEPTLLDELGWAIGAALAGALRPLRVEGQLRLGMEKHRANVVCRVSAWVSSLLLPTGRLQWERLSSHSFPILVLLTQLPADTWENLVTTAGFGHLLWWLLEE